MNALGILMFYNLIVDHPEVQFTPRTYLFGARLRRDTTAPSSSSS